MKAIFLLPQKGDLKIMFKRVVHLCGLIKALALSKDCFCCPHDCNHDYSNTPMREGIVFWGKTPIITLPMEEEAPREVINNKLTPERARQMLFGVYETPIEVETRRAAAATWMWLAFDNYIKHNDVKLANAYMALALRAADIAQTHSQ